MLKSWKISGALVFSIAALPGCTKSHDEAGSGGAANAAAADEAAGGGNAAVADDGSLNRQAAGLLNAIAADKTLDDTEKADFSGKVVAVQNEPPQNDRVTHLNAVIDGLNEAVEQDKMVKFLTTNYKVTRDQAILINRVASMKIDVNDDRSLHEYADAFQRLTAGKEVVNNPELLKSATDDFVKVLKSPESKTLVDKTNANSKASKMVTWAEKVEASNSLDKIIAKSQ